DAADIPVRAVELGVNYLDTANAYGPSQSIYGEAFRRMRLAPWQADYNAALREQLFIATKTGQRSAAGAVSELKRSLTLLFGDGKGWFPDEAYLDSIQIHNLTSVSQVDQIYDEKAGALMGLLDYRDGTNRAGLNPEHRSVVRHLGITGHYSSVVLMNALQRDKLDIIDTLLVALNANDRRASSFQYNAVPVARARGLGIVAMKVFCAGSLYTKLGRQPGNAEELIRSVGYPGGIDSADLVRYPLSVPGVATVIAGISAISREAPEADQIAANLAGALQDATTDSERVRIEAAVAELHGTGTNFFQVYSRSITQPPAPEVTRDSGRVIIRWQSALASSDALRWYDIWCGDYRLARIPFRPQTTSEPLTTWLPPEDAPDGPYRVEAVTA
ncbi:MAG: aldo/keto reductase, partial [Candidatus Solibacter usitatus]|nr:aldo/keto reductase [Candidatus Solibacter usitatus]